MFIVRMVTVTRLSTFQAGLALLISAATMVGIAIVMDGAMSRLLNGVGGVLWLASAAILSLTAARLKPPGRVWIALATVTVLVAFVVTPSALVPTITGFIPAGLLVAFLAPRDRLFWAAMVPAWYLPAHIGTAMATAAIRSLVGNEAPLRTDPPPTAAFVPLLMVLCALLGGYLAVRFVSYRSRSACANRGF